MGNEGVFNASKSGFSTYGKLFKAVAYEVSLDRALELHGGVFEDYGHEFNQMFNELSHDEVGSNIGAMLESMGYTSRARIDLPF